MSKKTNKEWLSSDSIDDNDNYSEFTEFIENHTTNQKKVISNNIIDLSDSLLLEIEEKKKLQNATKENHIKYIIKKSNKYSPKILREYDYNDVRTIYDEIKYENRSIFVKFLDLFF